MPDASSISACIICLDQVQRIGLALDSLAWCDEIVVVDSGSTDGTVELCRRHPSAKVRVMHQDWMGFNQQREFAANQCRNDWVLMLDADEECSDPLRREILALSESAMARVGVYEMPRNNHLAMRHVRCWGPDYQTRLVHKDRVVFDAAPIPEHREPKAGFLQRRLKSPLLHNRLTPYSPIDLCDGRRMQEYGLSLAATLQKRGKRAGFVTLVFRPFFAFLKYFVFKGGFLQGRFGLVIAYKTMIIVLLKYSVLYGKELAEEQPQERAGGGAPVEKAGREVVKS